MDELIVVDQDNLRSHHGFENKEDVLNLEQVVLNPPFNSINEGIYIYNEDELVCYCLVVLKK